MLLFIPPWVILPTACRRQRVLKPRAAQRQEEEKRATLQCFPEKFQPKNWMPAWEMAFRQHTCTARMDGKGPNVQQPMQWTWASAIRHKLPRAKRLHRCDIGLGEARNCCHGVRYCCSVWVVGYWPMKQTSRASNRDCKSPEAGGRSNWIRKMGKLKIKFQNQCSLGPFRPAFWALIFFPEAGNCCMERKLWEKFFRWKVNLQSLALNLMKTISYISKHHVK